MNQAESNRSDKTKGDKLKKAREAQGTSLETVHEITKIPLDVLRAIEEGYTVGTLSPFYLKAFMKKYAQYLDVDVSTVVEDYHKEELPEHIPPVSAEEGSKFQLDRWLNRGQQQWVIKAVVLLVALFFVGKFVGCMAGKIRRPRAERTVNRQTPPPEKTKEKSTPEVRPRETKDDKKKTAKTEKEPVVETRPAAAKPLPPGSPTTRPATDKVRLAVQATKGTWLQVKTDGNVVFQSNLNKGITETWQAAERIELTGKDIHMLELEVNGKAMGTLGRGDRNARRIIVTADGLSVKK